MANRLTHLILSAIGLVDKGANPESHIVLAKRDDVTKDEDKGYGSMADCMAALDDAAKCKELMAAMKRAELEGDHQMADTVTKADFEALQKRLTEESEARKASETKLAKMEEDAKTARDQVAKMQEEEATRQAVKKAEGLSHLPGNKPAEFGPILRKMLGALSAEEATKAEQILTAADNSLATSALLQEVGVGGANVAREPYEKLEQMAKELVQKKENLTFAQAFTKVCDTPEGKKLYKQYEDERAATARRIG